MDDDEGGMRLSKRFSDKGGEVDYKTKAGTAWSHSYLNQKPWHPLSYPNQRRKWIAEQLDAQHQRRTEEVAREFAQEQEFFRQTASISKKEKEKVEMMQAVSFMYVRPPGYNAESAKAAELEDERKQLAQNDAHQGTADAPPIQKESSSSKGPSKDDKKKPRPKDVFGRPLPTEEEFEILKNAPRLETGVPMRIKPFAVEVRNVKCVRCGTYGHQSGDRECPLKDAIMPNEESRLKRDDPLTVIMAHTDASEPLKWELKQKPGGISPARGGFRPDDPNQQIVAEDIYDEYGGFLDGGGVPDLFTKFLGKEKHSKRKERSKKSSTNAGDYKDHDQDNVVNIRSEKKNKKKKKNLRVDSDSSSYSTSDSDQEQRKQKHRPRSSAYSSSDSEKRQGRRRSGNVDVRSKRHKHKKTRHEDYGSSSYSDSDSGYNPRKQRGSRSCALLLYAVMEASTTAELKATSTQTPKQVRTLEIV
ncbi:putative zinc finger CCHC domain-containing protein [Nymphaea thermarum]|nr:putative zinc finger CCHC domain-containing protein [Nymphaea thermarum]